MSNQLPNIFELYKNCRSNVRYICMVGKCKKRGTRIQLEPDVKYICEFVKGQDIQHNFKITDLKGAHLNEKLKEYIVVDIRTTNEVLRPFQIPTNNVYTVHKDDVSIEVMKYLDGIYGE